MLTAAALASIPSPSGGAIHIGSLQLRMYGLMIALGVIAAVWLFGRRLEQKGLGTRDDAASIALWAVPAGVIGARIYHVVTDWQLFRDDPIRVFSIWEGGLGIWGGIGLGVAVGLWRGAKKGWALLPALDCVAPALALAQAIGRLGNWWNQELFGRPTTLPWGLEISLSNRPDGYEEYATFHPTFLYESLWNFGLCLALVAIDRRRRLRPGRLFVMYVAGYTFARFWIEGLRIDAANELLGLRVNEWVSALVFVGAAGFLVIDWLRHRGMVEAAPVAGGRPDSETAVPDGETADPSGVGEVPEDDDASPQVRGTAGVPGGLPGEAPDPTPSDGDPYAADSVPNRRRTEGGD